VPTASRSRTIAASAEELWEVIRDPHHLPRWWPRVDRVEEVDGASFTEVMKTAKGKVVRADFNVVLVEEGAMRLKWEQRVQDTPFAHVLKAAETEVRLAVAGTETEVTIELHQSLNGVFSRFGGYMVRRAANETIERALDGLERISV
jgi:uncharacterized protein YndB with AHSA1/START domain